MRLAAVSFALPLSALLAAPVCAQQPLVPGSAFVDSNRNGRRDPGERGLANVTVSNQDAVVATDSAGEFRIERGPNDIVFISVPDNYQTVGRFWRNVDDVPLRVEFALVEAKSPETFTFAHASDTHISPASVNRTQQLRVLVDSMRPAFVLIAGDLVKDALRVPEAEATSYYNLFMQELGRFVTPAFTVPGNHEFLASNSTCRASRRRIRCSAGRCITITSGPTTTRSRLAACTSLGSTPSTSTAHRITATSTACSLRGSSEISHAFPQQCLW